MRTHHNPNHSITPAYCIGHSRLQVPLSESGAVVIQNPAYYNVKAMVLGMS